MKPEHVEALSALFDREAFDSTILTEALRDPDAPAVLADFASLRAMAQDDAARPSDAFYERMAPVFRQHRWRGMWPSLAWSGLAASVLLVAGLAGYWVRPALEVQPVVVLESPRTRSAPSPITVTAPSFDVPSAAPQSGRATGIALASPPTPALRLRFSQWSPGTATVQPH